VSQLAGPWSGGAVLITPGRSQRWQHAVNPDIGSESQLLPTPPRGGSRRNIAVPLGTEKLEWLGYPMVENFWRYVYSFWQNVRTWQTETETGTHTHTNTAWRYRPRLHSIARQKCNIADTYYGRPMQWSTDNYICQCFCISFFISFFLSSFLKEISETLYTVHVVKSLQDRSQNVVDSFHSLVGVSHFAECREKRPLTVFWSASKSHKMPDFTMLREMEQETQLLLIQQASVTISDSGRSANSNRKHKMT